MRRFRSATLEGIDAREVTVEGSLTKGLPGFVVVGLPGEEVKEAKERAKAALLHVGFPFPPMKLTISLSPSDIRKSGSHFDLPIALATALQGKEVKEEGMFVFGELGLDGAVKATGSLFPLLLSLAGGKEPLRAVVPDEAASLLASIPNTEIYPVKTLEEATAFFLGNRPVKARKPEEPDFKALEIAGKRFYYQKNFPEEFAQVKGQKVAKRAALIAAAGFHNILFSGSPGCGKSMIVKRLRHVLPPMGLEEMLECARAQAMDGKEPEFKAVRPYRAPHHSATKASLYGGGSSATARIGEVALASGGILFFDELPHFAKSSLEALREPLEDHRLLVSRVNTKIEYRTKFLFAAAMNPCPCGNLLSVSKECRCTELEVNRYRNRLSEPLLDRIDLYVEMNETGMDQEAKVTSKALFDDVLRVFRIQKGRGQEEFNGKLDDKGVETFCVVAPEADGVLEQAAGRFGLSMRGVNKALRVARTIADLDGVEKIGKRHLLEALGYRWR